MFDTPVNKNQMPCPICGKPHATIKEFLDCVSEKGTRDQQAAAAITLLDFLVQYRTSHNVIDASGGEIYDPTHGEDCTKCELLICSRNTNIQQPSPVENVKPVEIHGQTTIPVEN